MLSSVTPSAGYLFLRGFFFVITGRLHRTANCVKASRHDRVHYLDSRIWLSFANCGSP